MKIHVETDNERRQLLVDGDMNIYSAQYLKQQFLNHLASTTELEINLAQVGEMDTAGFQVLYLAKREAIKSGKALRLTSHSPAVLKIIDLYNMAAYFGDPLVITRTRKKAHAPRSKSKVKKAI